MIRCQREITKEQYDRAIRNGGVITRADRQEIFSDAERYGYGIYGASAFQEDGKYMVSYSRGETCD